MTRAAGKKKNGQRSDNREPDGLNLDPAIRRTDLATDALDVRTSGAALSLGQVATVLRLYDDGAGKTQQELATFFGVTQSTISRTLSAFKDTRPMAKARLQAAAHEIAGSAIQAAEMGARRGDGSVALELLDRLEIAPKRAEAGSGTKIVVIVGGSSPAALPPFFQAQPDEP